MGPIAFANCVPWVIPAWLPETTLVPALRRVPWPEKVDLGRILAAVLWQFALTAIVCREVYCVS